MALLIAPGSANGRSANALGPLPELSRSGLDLRRTKRVRSKIVLPKTAPPRTDAGASTVAGKPIEPCTATVKLPTTRPAAVCDPSKKCRDMRGRKHEIKTLRDRRRAAVMKGMSWMRKYLRKNNYAALLDVGDDAAQIFFEMWYTSADSRVRAYAKGISIEMLEKFCSRKVAGDWSLGLRSTSDFLQVMYLLRCEHELEMDTSILLQLADEAWKRLGLRCTDRLFGRQAGDLDDVETSPWLFLLMDILIMEFNRCLFPGRWPISWGLYEALCALRKHELTPPPHDAENRFSDSFYLATHIVYAMNAYQSIKTDARQAPWLFQYNRHCLTYWMKLHWKNDKAVRRCKKLVLLKQEEMPQLTEVVGAECIIEVGGAEAEGALTADGQVGDQLPDSLNGQEVTEAASVTTLDDEMALQSNVLANNHTLASEIGESKVGCSVQSAKPPKTKVPRSKKSTKGRSRRASVKKKGVPSCSNSSKQPTKPNKSDDGLEDQRRALSAKGKFIDIDGVAEAMDVLKGCGQTEASDPLLAEASLYLLRMQGKGGGWPNNLDPERVRLGKENKSQHYDKIHPTWVASQALRDRDYKIERPGNVAWQEHVNRLLKASNFCELGYAPTWPH